MDNKRLILSVAGSGKTTLITNSLSLTKRALIITYTNNNYENLRYKVAKKFGCIPENIEIMTYFKFLYTFCHKPLLHNKVMEKGIDFHIPPMHTQRIPRTDQRYYLNQNRYLYHNRLAKLFEVQKILPDIISRIEKYFDELYVDEVQDFAGHDFNLLLNISQIDRRVTHVGDFYQHTFDTSRDGRVNCNLHEDIDVYISRFRKSGFSIDTETLKKSYRCNQSICQFVETELGISIQSHSNENVEIELVEEQNKINEIVLDNSIVKLFFQNSHKYDCLSNNWGASKGLDCYTDVCVVLNNKTYKQYKSGQLNSMNKQTRNKFYVACTRARRMLIFIPEKFVKDFKTR